MKSENPNEQLSQGQTSDRAESRKPTADRRISWGTGIALLYIGFVVGMLTLVIMSMNQRVDLVSDDYYAQELGFQKKIDKIQRAKALAEPLRWEVNGEELTIRYPASINRAELSGKVIFYCPSDNRKDSEFTILPNAQNQQIIPLSKLQSGRYKLQFDWKKGETTFWDEGVITVQN